MQRIDIKRGHHEGIRDKDEDEDATGMRVIKGKLLLDEGYYKFYWINRWRKWNRKKRMKKLHLLKDVNWIMRKNIGGGGGMTG